MERGRVNERILEGIRRQSAGDRAISDFLIEVIYREAEHPSRWKNIYRQAVEKSSKQWRETDEN